jgi:hypothetical protein
MAMKSWVKDSAPWVALILLLLGIFWRVTNIYHDKAVVKRCADQLWQPVNCDSLGSFTDSDGVWYWVEAGGLTLAIMAFATFVALVLMYAAFGTLMKVRGRNAINAWAEYYVWAMVGSGCVTMFFAFVLAMGAGMNY